MPADKRVGVGVSFPAGLGTVTAIWPCGVAVVGEAGLGVEVRPGLFKRFLLRFVEPRLVDTGLLWQASWSDLAVVDVGPRSVVLRTEGSRGCRVVFVRRRELQSLLDELIAHQIGTHRVRTTFGWYLR